MEFLLKWMIWGVPPWHLGNHVEMGQVRTHQDVGFRETQRSEPDETAAVGTFGGEAPGHKKGANG